MSDSPARVQQNKDYRIASLSVPSIDVGVILSRNTFIVDVFVSKL